MSFGLGHDRELDPGAVGVSAAEFPPIPDAALTDPLAARLDPRGWFAHSDRPFEIEIGSGKGTFLLRHGGASPGVNILGIEWAREFYLYGADRVRRACLENVRMLNTDATVFLKWRMPDAVVSVIHLYFSDPWPKSRHHRRRVVQDEFLAQALRVLVPGGELRIVTDHEEYWEWMEAHFSRWCAPGHEGAGFERSDFDPPAWVGEGQTVGTNYEVKMCASKPPFAAVLRKPGGLE
jgi:tRNA (guanine-N7-)-methyltransferase